MDAIGNTPRPAPNTQEDALTALLDNTHPQHEFAWQKLTAEFTPPISQVIRTTCQGLDAAQVADLVQETFQRAWEHAGSFRGRSATEGQNPEGSQSTPWTIFRAWVRAIARDCAFKSRRKVDRRRREDDFDTPTTGAATYLADAGALPDEQLDDEHTAAQRLAGAAHALAGLDGWKRELIVCVHAGDCGTTELARSVDNIPPDFHALRAHTTDLHNELPGLNNENKRRNRLAKQLQRALEEARASADAFVRRGSLR